MKNLVLLLTLISSVSFSAPVIKTGKFITGYDRELQVVLTKNIQVWINKEGVSEMQIEGEELLEATFEDSKVTAYVSKPKKYLYYSLDLNPKTAPFNDKNLIILAHEDNSNDLVYRTRYCHEGATAVLTAYAGDKTKKTFCATLK